MQVFGYHKHFLYIRTRWASNSKHKNNIIFISRINASYSNIYIYLQCSKTSVITGKIKNLQMLDHYNISKNIRKMDIKVCIISIIIYLLFVKQLVCGITLLLNFFKKLGVNKSKRLEN